ncbi:MAG: bifunctional DNA-formamidopyrimidine glycosylase/DNA-(apurinic or apyrimidinic site) lyase [Phycisphaerae bacterium]|nr:bifunctional DNA-formamidopyrimidine glycosylase/DNA-(apurinic or apyrimidinic site) lyase [Phycisphaerae bacterium]
MPELPEVEHLRATLAREVAGARVVDAELFRADMLERGAESAKRGAADLLLRGQRIERLLRHGKQLAIVGDGGGVLCVQLGMTGRVVVRSEAPRGEPHVHARWELLGPRGERKVMTFADPRRFGGLTALASSTVLSARWAELGPDAATVETAHLMQALKETRRAVKAALLDQNLVAGIGNIYADEALFRAGITPRVLAHRLRPRQVERLAAAVREVLAAAIASGGSSLRDYVDANGQQGGYQTLHLVYGREGEPCHTCGTRLRGTRLGGRQTVWCPCCQSARDT